MGLGVLSAHRKFSSSTTLQRAARSARRELYTLLTLYLFHIAVPLFCLPMSSPGANEKECLSVSFKSLSKAEGIVCAQTRLKLSRQSRPRGPVTNEVKYGNGCSS